MTEKKIGTCIKALVNVGNYQNIEIAKYAETTISYESEDEMLQKENQQTQELLDSLKRDLVKTPEELGRYEDKVDEFKGAVTKEMPKWLGEEAIPNIANSAKSVKKSSDNKKADELAKQANAAGDFEELIGEKSTEATESKKEVESVATESSNDGLDDIFGDDDDLFDD